MFKTQEVIKTKKFLIFNNFLKICIWGKVYPIIYSSFLWPGPDEEQKAGAEPTLTFYVKSVLARPGPSLRHKNITAYEK